MKFLKNPHNHESNNCNYLVIGFYRKKAIVKDQDNQLYFMICEENEAPVGTAIEKDYLQRIDKLSAEEQESIQEIYGRKED